MIRIDDCLEDVFEAQVAKILVIDDHPFGFIISIEKEVGQVL